MARLAHYSISCAKLFAATLYVPAQGHADIVRLLLAQPQIDVGKGRSVDGATALTMASCTGDVDVVRSLLGNAQIDVNKGSEDTTYYSP